MPDRALAATPAFDRKTLRVTAWPNPQGGLDVWFDDLALDADGDTEDEALTALILEVRILGERWLTDDRYQRAPNWRRRGALLTWLATLSDAELRDRFVVQHDGEAGHPLDA